MFSRCKRRPWWPIRFSASLALWTIVRPALSHHDPADRRSASRTKFSRASVDLMLLLKTAALAVGIHIVGNRRAFHPDRSAENVDHCAMQPPGALFAQAGRD